MKQLYATAQYFFSKLARKSKKTSPSKEKTLTTDLVQSHLSRGDLVYYENPNNLGLVMRSNPEVTLVDFAQGGNRELPTKDLIYYDKLESAALAFGDQELSDVHPIEIEYNSPPFNDDERYFGLKI